MPPLINITGKRFGKWLVIERALNAKWLCQCDCGNKVEVLGAHLRNGNSTKCNKCKSGVEKHGQSKQGKGTRKYRAWQAIRNRVFNANQKDYARYSALGMQSEWDEFSVFDADVPDPKSDDVTIDRIDTTLGYFRGNVRWVTQREQCRNRQGNVWIEFNGQQKLQSDWAKELKTDASTLRKQIAVFGIEAAFAKHGEKCNVEL